MSGNKSKTIDPVEAMKVLRTPAPGAHVDAPTEDDHTPGVLPVLPEPTPPSPQVFYVVEEDKMVSIRGQLCSWKKGREVDASSYGKIVIDSLIEQGLKLRRVERGG